MGTAYGILAVSVLCVAVHIDNCDLNHNFGYFCRYSRPTFAQKLPVSMSTDRFLMLLYFLPLAAVFVWYVRRQLRKESYSRTTLETAEESGLTEPPTLHPDIDRNVCIGCGNCVAACPEHPEHVVLGMIRNKARLVGPSDCIGHGACKAVCPVDAITLVFGTARRGVDIPQVKPDFETEVPGVFIAGELGGMGLIGTAIEQGRQAMESVIRLVKKPHKNPLDVVVVGAGPAGFSATLAANAANLRIRTIEQEELGGTVAHFPRSKLVLTRPVELPQVGKVKFKEVQKEQLIEFWREVEKKTGIDISYRERVDSVQPTADGFVVQTNRQKYQTRAVLLAIGRRGTPRKLGVPGEEKNKVVYRLTDPEQYRNLKVLVVGGGDSALEAATSIAAESGTSVTLSYRSAAFTRAKLKNREKIERMSQTGQLRVMFNSNVKSIQDDSVTIETAGTVETVPNDAIIVSAGGILPSKFLQSIGITVVTKHGTA